MHSKHEHRVVSYGNGHVHHVRKNQIRRWIKRKNYKIHQWRERRRDARGNKRKFSICWSNFPYWYIALLLDKRCFHILFQFFMSNLKEKKTLPKPSLSHHLSHSNLISGEICCCDEYEYTNTQVIHNTQRPE